jgi:hypothetical protein
VEELPFAADRCPCVEKLRRGERGWQGARRVRCGGARLVGGWVELGFLRIHREQPGCTRGSFGERTATKELRIVTLRVPGGRSRFPSTR